MSSWRHASATQPQAMTHTGQHRRHKPTPNIITSARQHTQRIRPEPQSHRQASTAANASTQPQQLRPLHDSVGHTVQRHAVTSSSPCDLAMHVLSPKPPPTQTHPMRRHLSCRTAGQVLARDGCAEGWSDVLVFATAHCWGFAGRRRGSQVRCRRAATAWHAAAVDKQGHHLRPFTFPHLL